jgi:hypothetical protein
VDDVIRRAVRIDSEGVCSLRPFVDFREPGRQLPPLPSVVRAVQKPAPPERMPEFLRKRLPSLVWIEPAGEA